MTSLELYQQRLRLGLKQVELAALLGVDKQTVYRWECGQRSIPPYLVLALEALEARG
jgi:transcriptional regulator with XRE-family HTH domain